MDDGPSTLPNADYKSRSQAIASISEKFGCSRDTGQSWVNKQAVEDGDRDGLTQSERDEFKALQRENRELKQANEILRKGEAFVRSPVHCATGSSNHWQLRATMANADRAVHLSPSSGGQVSHPGR